MRKIPFIFADSKITLDLEDVFEFYKLGVFDWEDVILYSQKYILTNAYNDVVMEISSFSKNEAFRIFDLLASIVDNNKACDRDKWLFLELSWDFEHKKEFLDPLGQVEIIYSDFDYPVEMESFIRYMPLNLDDAEKGDFAIGNEDRLFAKWSKYLEKGEQFFSPNKENWRIK